MFNIGFSELIIILLVAFLVVGPDKLPNLAKALGSGLKEFKTAIQNVKEDLKVDETVQTIKDEVASFTEDNTLFNELKEAKQVVTEIKSEFTNLNPLKSEMDQIKQEVQSVKKDLTAPISDVKKELNSLKGDLNKQVNLKK